VKSLTLGQVQEVGCPASHGSESPLFTHYFWSPETKLVFGVASNGLRTPIKYPPKKRWHHQFGCDCEFCSYDEPREPR